MAYLVTAASVAIHGVDVSWCVGVVLRIIVCADPSVVGCGIRVGVFVTVVVCSASLLRLLCLQFSSVSFRSCIQTNLPNTHLTLKQRHRDCYEMGSVREVVSRE